MLSLIDQLPSRTRASRGAQTRLVKLYALVPHPAAPFLGGARQTHPRAPTQHFHQVGKADL